MPKSPVLSLLDAVRTQLSLDSDSDRSQSPMLSSEKWEKVQRSDISLEQSSSEPFPDYEDSLLTNSAIENAYKAAFAAAMQDDIRARTVEPSILSPAKLPDNKQRALDAIKECLSNPLLHYDTRKRFIALTNMVIRLDDVLYSDTDEGFLNPHATAEAQRIATVILDFASWVDGMMKEMIDTATKVYDVLELLLEDDISDALKYQRMARVVSAHLKKPRRREHILLGLFLDLYDEWVHNKFLHLRNAQIHQEETLDISRLHLTRTLHAIWDVLSRGIENYEEYRVSLVTIKNKFFPPILGSIPVSTSAPVRCFSPEKD